MMNIKPGKTCPALSFPVLGVPERRWDIEEARPDSFSLLIFYRGAHCPICRDYLRDFESLMDEFLSLGVEAVALSMDDKEHAERAQQEWGLEKLPVGFALSEDDAQRWGLFISESINESEPKLFSEPGLFFVRPDQELFYAAINSMPFGRPDPKEMLNAIRLIQKKDYPARGKRAA